MSLIIKWVLIYLIIWGLYRMIFRPGLNSKTKKKPQEDKRRFEGKNAEDADFEEIKD